MSLSSCFRSFNASASSRVIVLGLLILVLQLPISAIGDLIDERRQTEQEAVSGIARIWGTNQLIRGPILTVPFRITSPSGAFAQNRLEAYFTPKTIRITGNVKTEERYRGIFRVPVYTATLHLSGTFDAPKDSDFLLASGHAHLGREILWDQATVALDFSEPEKIQEKILLKWNATESEFRFANRKVKAGARNDAIVAPIAGLTAEGTSHAFELTVTIKGSSTLEFLPLAEEASISLDSNWPHPGFIGNSLPITRDVTAAGFHADWKVLGAGGAYPTNWHAGDRAVPPNHDQKFGVSLYSPLDTYRMNERLIKYQLFIIFLTFLTFYVFELLNRLAIHPIQYLLIGAALCLFYLLTLSFSEHFGFALAYLTASLSAVGLVWYYSCYVLRDRARGAILAAILSSLYAYFYVVLQEQDYAMLFGSIGLTLILALIMHLTRNVNWYSVRSAPPEPVAAGEN